MVENEVKVGCGRELNSRTCFMPRAVAGAQGLAYSVSGGFDTSPVDHPGLFVAGGETAAPAEFLALLKASLQVSAKLLSS